MGGPHVRRRFARLAAASAFVLTLGAAVVIPGVASAQPAPSSSPEASSVPISFQVHNVNRSKLACASDGATYTVRGHLVRPTGAPSGADTATLYLHGLALGEFFWDYQGVPGYDYAAAQAAAGQTSVVIDRLGYGASDKPAGPDICIGSQADIAHQMVTALRSGSYQLGSGTNAPAFPKVVLAGHSLGGTIAQVEAYSFGDINGMIVMSFTDGGNSALAKEDVASWTKACASGGMHVTDQSGPTGYAPFSPPALAEQSFFFNADPTILAAAKAKMVRDPCGDQTSFMPAIKADLAHVGEINVPILFVIGDKDALFPPQGAAQQVASYTASPSVTSAMIPGASHALTLEPNHQLLRSTVTDWLRTHVQASPAGGVAAGAGGTAGGRDSGLLGLGGIALLGALGMAFKARRHRLTR